MKYIIRSGKVKGEGQYLVNGASTGRYPDGAWQASRANVWRFGTRKEADKVLHCFMPDACRIVPLLSAAEAKRKFAAGVLREAVVRHVANPHDGARLMQMADELWPAKGEK